MSYKMRPCPVCGELMKAWSNRKYCSPKCKQKVYRANRKSRYGSVTVAQSLRTDMRCRNCGDRVCYPRMGQEYCSPACKQAMYRQRKKFSTSDSAPRQMEIPESAYTISNTLP